MSKKVLFFVFIYSLVNVLFSACLPFNKKSSKNAKSYYETFFINDSTFQYFIKPIDFYGSGKLTVDYSFRKIKRDYSHVTLNFSFISNKKNEITTLQIVTDSAENSVYDIKLLFKEKQNDNYLYRYTSKINVTSVRKMFNAKECKIFINNISLLTPTKKSKNKIKYINNNLFGFELSN